jgi:hypothetical protein
MVESAQNEPSEDRSDYITVYRAVGGWQSVLMTWDEEDGVGMWGPWQTGMGPYRTIGEAVIDAQSWAENEEVRYVPYENERGERLGEWLQDAEFQEFLIEYKKANVFHPEQVGAALTQIQEAILRKVFEVYEPTRCIAERAEPKPKEESDASGST